MVNNELCLHKSWGDKKGECNHKAKKKYMCVYCHMSKKSRVGRSNLLDQMSVLFCLLQGLIFRLLNFENTVEGDTFTDINISHG
jgi:hypothetical protein